MNEAKAIGRQLRAARLKAGLSQWQLADLADTVQAQITTYESGTVTPTLPRLRQICFALGLRAEDVLSWPAPGGLFTAAEASQRLGMAEDRVQRLAKSMRLGARLGPRIVLSADDIERLRPFVGRGAGNPNFGRQTP